MGTLDQPLAQPFLCARPECRAPIQNPRASGEPFKDGPHKGGFLCFECWVLDWDEASWCLADESTRGWISEEASRIRLRRQTAEVIFQHGLNVAHLTERATIRIHIEKSMHCADDEYDPERLRMLQQALAAILEKMPMWAVQPPEPAPGA